MKLSDLRPAKGATKNKKRKGRGIAAGQGKTAGRGTKGQGARAGGVKGPYFERGFTNIYRIPYAVVNLEALEKAFEAQAQVTPEVLLQKGLIDNSQRVKVLGRGELTKALQVSAHAFSDSAKEKIAAAGGSVSELAWQRPPRRVR